MFKQVVFPVYEFVSSAFRGFESPEERKKFGILAVLFGLTIGVYWILRPLKDGVFLTMVGSDLQPRAKIISMFVVIPVVMIYECLVSTFARHRVLYGLSIFYAISTAIFAYFILHPTLGMGNVVSSPDRYLGWAFYLFVESFGSIMVMLFWSFVADTTTPDSAKRGYPLVVLGAQVGGVAGPLIASWFMPDKNLHDASTAANGSGIVTGLCVFLLAMIPVVVYYFMHNVSKAQLEGFNSSEKKPLEGKPKAGFFEGLTLLVTRPYLLGIFAVVSFYEIIVTFLDYQFKVLAKLSYQGDALTSYLFNYAVWTNGVAFLCIAFGLGKVANKLGLGKTLLLLPVLITVAVLTLNFHPVLWVAFIIMVFSKGVNYALNQPAKEQLYIPTTKDTKYKAKAWIDAFGSRSSKGLASIVNDRAIVFGPEMFMYITMAVSFGLIGVWAFAAVFLAKTHGQAIKENRTVC